MKLFLWADKEDREARFNKNVVKAFYRAGMLFDVLTTFGEVSPEVAHYRKYAKVKAAYIHNCLKNGETPISGPIGGEEGEEEGGALPSVPRDDEGAPAQDPGAPSHPPPAAYPPAGYNQPPAVVYPAGYNQPLAAGYPASQPAAPQAVPFNNLSLQPPQGAGAMKLSLEQIGRAQKLCKYAISALDYEDVTEAVNNLNKALLLCTTGQEPN